MSQRFTKGKEKKVLLKGTYLLKEHLEKAAGHGLAYCLTWLSTAWLAATLLGTDMYDRVYGPPSRGRAANDFSLSIRNTHVE